MVKSLTRMIIGVAAILGPVLLPVSAGASVTAPVVNGVTVNPSTHMGYAVEQGTSGTTATSCTSTTDGKLAVFSPTATAPSATITVGCVPIAVAINPTTNMVYVLNYGAQGKSATTLSVINGATNKVTQTISGLPTTASAIAVNPVTNTILVTTGASSQATTPGTLVVLSGATGAIVAQLGTAIDPRAVAVNTSTNTYYVTNQVSKSVTVFSGSSNSLIANVTLSSTPAGVSVDSMTNMVYVATSTGLTLFNGATNTVASTVSLGSNLESVAVDHTNGLVFANSTTTSLVYSLFEGSGSAGPLATESSHGSVYATGLGVDPGQGLVDDAMTSYGAVALTPETNFLTPQSPAAPTLTSQSKQLTVSWTAPVDKGTPITGYQVLYATSASGSYAPAGSTGTCYKPGLALSCTLGGLTTGTRYYVEVRASNTAGYGTSSAPASAVAN